MIDRLTPVRRIGRSVWQAEAGGARYAVKDLRARGGHPGSQGVWPEVVALDALGDDGAPVPRLVAFDPDQATMVTAWVDGQSIDAALQGADPGLRSAERLVSSHRALAASFHRIWPAMVEWAAPGHRCDAAGKSEALDAERANMRRLAAGLADLAEAAAAGDPCSPKPAAARRRRAWERAVEAIAAAPAEPGSLDLNAHNVKFVRDEAGGCVFLDFSSVGWSWPGRRLTAYGSALGGVQGEFGSLFAGAPPPIGAPDDLWAHHLFFWGLVTARLTAALRAPDSEAAAAVRRTWGDPGRRMPQALRIWSSPPASSDARPAVEGVSVAAR